MQGSDFPQWCGSGTEPKHNSQLAANANPVKSLRERVQEQTATDED